MLRALPAAAIELPRRIGPGEAPGADLRQSCDFTNIEAGRCFHTDFQSLAHQDRSLIGDCDHALYVFPYCRFDVGPPALTRREV